MNESHTAVRMTKRLLWCPGDSESRELTHPFSLLSKYYTIESVSQLICSQCREMSQSFQQWGSKLRLISHQLCLLPQWWLSKHMYRARGPQKTEHICAYLRQQHMRPAKLRCQDFQCQRDIVSEGFALSRLRMSEGHNRSSSCPSEVKVCLLLRVYEIDSSKGSHMRWARKTKYFVHYEFNAWTTWMANIWTFSEWALKKKSNLRKCWFFTLI